MYHFYAFSWAQIKTEILLGLHDFFHFTANTWLIFRHLKKRSTYLTWKLVLIFNIKHTN